MDIGLHVLDLDGAETHGAARREARADAEIDPARIKPLLAVDTRSVPLPASWRALVDFVAHYYQQPIGEVAAMAAPPAISATRAQRAVRRLRAKMDDPFKPKLLHNVRGMGYVLEERT
mgnify:CR=1 FL=1